MKLNVIQPEKTFQCNQCGTCCSHIRGMMPREDKEFIEKMALYDTEKILLITLPKNPLNLV